MHCTFLTLTNNDNTLRLPIGTSSSEPDCMEAAVQDLQQQRLPHYQGHMCDLEPQEALQYITARSEQY